MAYRDRLVPHRECTWPPSTASRPGNEPRVDARAQNLRRTGHADEFRQHLDHSSRVDQTGDLDLRPLTCDLSRVYSSTSVRHVRRSRPEFDVPGVLDAPKYTCSRTVDTVPTECSQL